MLPKYLCLKAVTELQNEPVTEQLFNWRPQEDGNECFVRAMFLLKQRMAIGFLLMRCLCVLVGFFCFVCLGAFLAFCFFVFMGFFSLNMNFEQFASEHGSCWEILTDVLYL